MSDGVSFVGVSKLISVNVGMVSNVCGVSYMVSISKSVGNGRVSDKLSGVFCVAGIGICVDELSAEVCMRPTLLRARINACRSSAGMSSGKSDMGFASSSGASFGVSDSGGVHDSAGVGVLAGLKMLGIFSFGNCIDSSGFLVRIISVVVAMYRGNAAKSIMPKTKPPKPRSCARNRCCHWDALNIEKLNIKYNTAHVIII